MDRDKQLAFTPEEYRSRLGRLQNRLHERALSGLVTTTPENITYLTGFQTPGYYTFQALVVPVTGEPVLVVRHLEAENVRYFAWTEQVAPFQDDEDPVALASDVMSDLGLLAGRPGIELDSWFLTTRQYRQLEELSGAEFVDAGGSVEELRVIKFPAEVEHIRSSCRAAEEGLRRGIAAAGTGANENEVAAAVHEGVILSGGEHPGLPPFILSGPRTRIPHGTWGGRRIEDGDPLYFEICGTTHRYTGARMHGAVIGEPSVRHRLVAEASIAGVRAAIAAIHPGVASHDVDRACRDTIAGFGFGREAYRHRCGYSVGIAYAPDWGEGHIFSLRPSERRVLEPGMTFHIPPAIFDTDFAFGFSETVLVTNTGCEVLTDFPLELTVV